MKLKTMTAILGPMTAMERARGRYMRAPDHSAGDAGTGGGGDSSDAGSGGGEGDAGDTAAALDKEFGMGDTPTSDDDGGDDGDDGEEDLGSEDSGDDDGEGGQDDGDDDGDDTPDEQPKTNRSEERIREHENARREAERQASEAKREAEKWRRIAEGSPAQPEPFNGGEGEKDPNAAPDPADFEFGIADPDYIAANAEFKAIARLRREGQEANFRAQLNEMEAKYQSAIPSALEKYPDYDEVVTKGSQGDEPKWQCSPLMSVTIRLSDVGTDIAYHLAKNPAEASRIAGLDNIEAARELGKLEGRYAYLSEQSAKSKTQEPKPQGQGTTPKPATNKTKAPTPPKQVRGQAGKFKVAADTSDFAAFDKAYGN